MNTINIPIESIKKRRRILKGCVVSDKMQKTVVVEITRKIMHPLYKKMRTRSLRVKAHDEKNEYKAGDRVIIEEARPLSKEKRWRVLRKA